MTEKQNLLKREVDLHKAGELVNYPETFKANAEVLLEHVEKVFLEGPGQVEAENRLIVDNIVKMLYEKNIINEVEFRRIYHQI